MGSDLVSGWCHLRVGHYWNWLWWAILRNIERHTCSGRIIPTIKNTRMIGSYDTQQSIIKDRGRGSLCVKSDSRGQRQKAKGERQEARGRGGRSREAGLVDEVFFLKFTAVTLPGCPGCQTDRQNRQTENRQTDRPHHSIVACVAAWVRGSIRVCHPEREMLG